MLGPIIKYYKILFRYIAIIPKISHGYICVNNIAVFGSDIAHSYGSFNLVQCHTTICHKMLFFIILFFDKQNIICLWAIFVLFCRRPHTSMDIFISFDFFIFFFTPFCICCFTLLCWHLCTLGFIKRDLFTSPFPSFDLVALLFIIHPTFLFWHLLTNLNFFRSTLFMRDLFTILNLSYEIKRVYNFTILK